MVFYIYTVTKFEYIERSRPLSVQSRDACSQTESVDDELFLKDVIIRLPSASISKSKHNIIEKAAEIECTIEHIENETKKSLTEDVSKRSETLFNLKKITSFINLQHR